MSRIFKARSLRNWRRIFPVGAISTTLNAAALAIVMFIFFSRQIGLDMPGLRRFGDLLGQVSFRLFQMLVFRTTRLAGEF